MRRFFLLIYVLSAGATLVAQSLNGTYKNGSDSLAFSEDQIIFRVSGFGGLSSVQVGVGAYERVDDFLLVHTSDYPGEKVAVQEVDGSRSDTCVVKVVSSSNYPVQGILVTPSNVSRKQPGGKVTGDDGKVHLTHTEKTENITVSGMGYNTITIDYNPGHDYLVRLVENEVIEDKTVVFRFIEVDDETISVLLLTDEFDTSKKRDSELKKLEKRARKNNRVDKRFKKEYEPYARKIRVGQ